MTQLKLPHPDLTMTAKCLTNRELNKQITEAKQIYTANRYGWGRQGNPHPYEMCKGYDEFVAYYIVCMYKEWQTRLVQGKRGGVLKHKSGEFILDEIDSGRIDLSDMDYPHWYNNSAIFSSHRSALLYKNYEHYKQFGWSESPAIPIKITKKGVTTLPYVYGTPLNP